MRPTAGLGNAAAGKQFIEPGIAVGVDDAPKVLQMPLRMFALAVGRIKEQSRRWPRTGAWPLIANIGPQPAGLGLAGAGREHRYWRVVDMQSIAVQDVGGEGVEPRLEGRWRRPVPAA